MHQCLFWGCILAVALCAPSAATVEQVPLQGDSASPELGLPKATNGVLSPEAADKILPLLDSPFNRTVFLDTDTQVCSEFFELFDLLDRFDLAVAHAPWRIPATDVAARSG